ncbi:iron uptake porin [Dolichospermum planctonicum UHCC 0167]|uniref:iron uptake porin n=1 Tax=Dolichospermum planctonicum TaxID=136072 RepID=UPI00144365A5|nr:iron uptake porin [Dolichospermum planctonicum]MCW9681806.1 iron uptake porin [Dolichospermum planctonicum UHCC 0167]
MQKFSTYLLASSTVISAILCLSSGAWAEEIPANNQLQADTNSQQLNTNNQQEVMSQVTSVSQLSDVQPNDWAFQALQSLVERYGCAAGYPNNTYRGNRALSRYEFAAGLNACLDRVNELIATATSDLVSKQDLATIQKLQRDFSSELATLKGRVDTVEAKTTELEANQFSTTTKLQGQVVAVVSDVVSGKKVGTNDITDKNTTLGARTRLELVSSFTGKDKLLTRLESNNINTPNIQTSEGKLSFASGAPSNNISTGVSIGVLSYGFPLTKNTYANIIANDGIILDLDTTVNLFDGNGGSGALSAFATRNPIYSQLGGAGLGVNQKFGKNLTLSLGYLANKHNTPTAGNGLFNGPYGALAQLTVKPSSRTALGLTYINSYNQPLGTGSKNATFTDLTPGTNFSSNSYGVQASLGLSKRLVLGGWAGYTNSQILTGTKGEVETWNYAVTLGLPDLGKKGNLAGVLVGMEPKVTNSTATAAGVTKDPNTSYHIEGFYQYKVSDNITITPGVIWLTAPNHDKNNDSVVIGALRTTFSF